ncbi:MAG: flagellar biosynthesis anti-sigma factor FlgM [Gammaproteobacteria bacterium]|nr:flagellar biosynthesis anti-sigma factor FlgM [Gammaproteobacteria bacterium]
MSPINNINRSTTDAMASNTSKTSSSNKTVSQAESRPASGDTVSLSAEGLQIGELKQQLDALPDVDAEKVAAIKQEIARGNYPLDPERIAENLINLEKALTE